MSTITLERRDDPTFDTRLIRYLQTHPGASNNQIAYALGIRRESARRFKKLFEATGSIRRPEGANDDQRS
jgi:DNA-binding Lrp family transcriptional regulator